MADPTGVPRPSRLIPRCGADRGQRALVAALACALHLAILVPTIGQDAGSVQNDFAPQSIAIEGGDKPYRDQELEYPPLSIPVLMAPALTSEGIDGYNDHFEAWMLLFDLAIVALLAFAAPGGRNRAGPDRLRISGRDARAGGPRRGLAAVAVYSLGIVALSGIVLGDSDIDEAPLALSRFDLVPAFLVLAAVLARESGRSATWSALLATGVAVKAFPLALFPALARDEPNPWRAALAAAVPLAVSVAVVVAFGDEFGSAIGYHAERSLQIESVAATPLELAYLDDVSAGARFGSGSFNYVGPGSEVARAVTVAALIFLYGLVLLAGWRARAISHLRLATALLATIAILSPVLSPQFLFWLLPLSAAAFGLGAANWVLVAAFAATQLMLQQYSRVVVDFDAEFVWRLAGRNALLLAYLGLVVWPVLKEGLPAPAGGT